MKQTSFYAQTYFSSAVTPVVSGTASTGVSISG